MLKERNSQGWEDTHRSSLAGTGRYVIATNKGATPVPPSILTERLFYEYSNWRQVDTAIAQFVSELESNQSTTGNLALLDEILSEEGLAQDDPWQWASPF